MKSVLGLLSQFQLSQFQLFTPAGFSFILETSTTNISIFSYFICSRVVVMVKCLMISLEFLLLESLRH